MRVGEGYYEYVDDGVLDRIKATKIVDGDTIDIRLWVATDIGFGVTSIASTEIRLRLAHINAPETNRRAERPAGLKAKAWLANVIALEGLARIRTYKTDAFGRYVAELWSTADDETSINERLVDAGHAEYRTY